jgi:uncharacterized membrane protein YbjE (DUF340 family)
LPPTHVYTDLNRLRAPAASYCLLKLALVLGQPLSWQMKMGGKQLILLKVMLSKPWHIIAGGIVMGIGVALMELLMEDAIEMDGRYCWCFVLTCFRAL